MDFRYLYKLQLNNGNYYGILYVSSISMLLWSGTLIFYHYVSGKKERLIKNIKLPTYTTETEVHSAAFYKLTNLVKTFERDKLTEKTKS